MTNKHFGSCLCKSIQFEAIGAPTGVAACHCVTCRKHTGAPVAVFVDYLLQHVTFSGAALNIFESSQGVRRGFCGICGSTLSYQGDNRPNMIHLHIGAFDTPIAFTPTDNENADTRLPWLHIDTTP